MLRCYNLRKYLNLNIIFVDNPVFELIVRVLGGKDGTVLIWSMVGKFTRCLGLFRHPKPVMNVYLQDMRVLSGCMDGKMRIWNIVSGDCLRLLRGNSRSEPIYHMWPVGDTR